MERTLMQSYKGLQVPCRVWAPDAAPISRVVLGVHDFCGCKESPFLAAVGEEMGLYHSALVTFDLPGHGESPLPGRMLNLHNCRESLLCAAELARELYPDVEDFCVFAMGFGGYLTLLYFDDLMEDLGSFKLVLEAPAVRMHESFLAIARLSQEQLLKKGRVVCGFDRKMELPYSFYEELATHNAVANYDMPMMILQGDRDEVVSLAEVEFFRLLNDRSKLVIFPDTGHRFKGDGELDMIVDLTRDWFLCEEVLLSEWQ